MAKQKVSVEGEDEVILITPEQIKLIEKTVETNLAKNNITNTLIAGFKKEYMALKINGPDDKDGFEIVYAARQKTKNTRILIKNICKAGRAPLKAEADEWMKKEKELVAEVVPIEEHLQKEEDAYEEQREAEKRKKIEAQIERNKVRVTKLKELGVEWDGASYTLDDLSYSADTIRETEEEYFQEKIIPQFKAIADAKAAIAKANQEALELQEKLRKEAQAELDRQQAAFREEQRIFKEQQEAAQKKEQDRLELELKEKREADEKRFAEYKKKEDDRINVRLNQLVSLGLKFDFNGGYYVNFDVFIHTLDITGYDDEKWDELIVKAGEHIESYKKQEAEKESDLIEKEKQNAIALAETQRKEREQLAEQKRQQEIEDGKESVKYAETVNYLKATPIYSFRSGRYIAKMRVIRDFLADLEKQ